MSYVFSRRDEAVLQLLETSWNSNQMDLHIGNVTGGGFNRNCDLCDLRPIEIMARSWRSPSRFPKRITSRLDLWIFEHQWLKQHNHCICQTMDFFSKSTLCFVFDAVDCELRTINDGTTTTINHKTGYRIHCWQFIIHVTFQTFGWIDFSVLLVVASCRTIHNFGIYYLRKIGTWEIWHVWILQKSQKEKI